MDCHDTGTALISPRMKLSLFIALLFVNFGVAGQTVQQSQALAIYHFPDLAKAGSAVNHRFLELAAAARQKDPALDADAYWPQRLAREATADLAADWPDGPIEQIQIEEGKRLAGLRSAGLQRKGEESIIRLASLLRQRRFFEGKDALEQQRIDVRIAQIHQAMDKVVIDAAFGRWQHETEIEISALKSKAGLAQAKGELAKWSAMQFQIQQLSDQLQDSRRFGEIVPPPKQPPQDPAVAQAAPAKAENSIPELPTGAVPILFEGVRTDYAAYAGKGPVWVIGYVKLADSPARFGPLTHFGFEVCDKSGRWRGVFDGDRESDKLRALRAKILEKGQGRCALLIRLDRDPFLRRDEMSGELLGWAKAPAVK